MSGFSVLKNISKPIAAVNIPMPAITVFLILSESRAPKKIPSRPPIMMAVTLMKVPVIYFIFDN
jgi:hypothetical protein